MKILLCTDGSSHAARALDMGVRVAQGVASAVDILAVAGRAPEEGILQAAGAAADLEAAGIPVAIHRSAGRLAEETVRQARAAPYDLIVIGSRGRRGVARLLLGSVALHVAGHTPVSVLVVKGRPRDLKRFLVCSAAGPVSERTVRFAGRLARLLCASVTLLHVMSQLPLAEDAVPDDLEASAEELIRRGSPEGAHLGRMLGLLEAERIEAHAVVRHGLVLEEIIAEARQGRYDLLATGAHVTPGLNGFLVEDLSADVLLAARRPVLVVR
ncbi:MAG TPA: universal stress protein [Chloroflexi bacterium]|nr:universal stress protein [Chloroflexota bacterium]